MSAKFLFFAAMFASALMYGISSLSQITNEDMSESSILRDSNAENYQREPYEVIVS